MRARAIDLARRAGALLVDYLGRPRQLDHKGRFDLVTDADRASEALIVGELAAAYPDHAIFAEEGSGSRHEAAIRWTIDPLDGTTNYAHGFPYFSVSIAALEGETPILGVVYAPLLDALFVAERGAGATCNNRPLRVSVIPTLERSLLSTGFPYTYASIERNNLTQFDAAQRRCQGVRRAGSAALDLAYVAAGNLEAHWEYGLNAWDSAAGALLVTEAGGRITTCDGLAWTPFGPSMLASNGAVHAELLEILD